MSNNHPWTEVHNWNGPNDSKLKWDKWENELKAKFRSAEGGYLLEPALIPMYNPDPVGPFVPVPALPAGGIAWLTAVGLPVAETERRLKTLDRYMSQKKDHDTAERNVNALRMKHRSVSEKCTSILQEGFPQECQAGRIVKDAIRTAPAGTEAHIILQQIYQDLETVFRPNKPSDAQMYTDRLNNLRSDDGRGWAMYMGDFNECITELFAMGQPPNVGNIQSFISHSFGHTKLMHFLTQLISENAADHALGAPPLVPRWRVFFANVTTQINANNSFDIINDAQAYNAVVPGRKDAPRPLFCFRCWRVGHQLTACEATSCAGCGDRFAVNAFHETRNSKHARPAFLGAPRDNGARGPGGRDGRGGGGGRSGHRGGRGWRGGRGGGRGDGHRGNKKRPHDYEPGGKHWDPAVGEQKKKAKANVATKTEPGDSSTGANTAANSTASNRAGSSSR
jgi:hypothetical protein